ncbi:MAG: beta-lactamase family protein [Saprospiraceae bacterium]|nr:beta-lactamase family protein [Saprospiraceae bacterium]
MNKSSFFSKSIAGLIFVALFWSGCNHRTGIELGVSKHFSVDTLVSPFVRDDNTWALSIAITNGIEERFFNYGNISGNVQIPPTAESIYEIGSITKTFTTTMLAQMVEEGKLSLDGNIVDFLPANLVEWPEDRKISFLDLATHHSGLPRIPDNLKASYAENPGNPYAAYQEEELLDFLRQYVPEEPRKRQVSYSNLGMGLLGYLLVKIDGQPDYESMVSRRIFEPLHMEMSFIEYDKQQLIPGHDEKGKVVSSWEMPVLPGAGAIRSDAKDMLKYVSAQMQGKFSPGILFKPYFDWTDDRKILLGWMSRPLGGTGFTQISHSGGTGGFRSFIGFVAEKNTGVVVLANSAHSVDEIGEALLTGLLEKPRVVH